VEVFLKNGSTRKATSRNPYFLTYEEVVSKCKYYLGKGLKSSTCDQFVDSVLSIEKLGDVNELTRMLLVKK
jgi:hypothetical protein